MFYNPVTNEIKSKFALQLFLNASIPATIKEIGGWFLIEDQIPPEVDSQHKVFEGPIELIDGKYQKTWIIEEKSKDEIENDLQDLFDKLREERDKRIAATDYLILPDYPISDSDRILIENYRQALRDLPSQSGAPWDGGSELTPWPEKPEIK